MCTGKFFCAQTPHQQRAWPGGKEKAPNHVAKQISKIKMQKAKLWKSSPLRGDSAILISGI